MHRIQIHPPLRVLHILITDGDNGDNKLLYNARRQCRGVTSRQTSRVEKSGLLHFPHPSHVHHSIDILGRSVDHANK